jgi:hypothetical protein
MAQNEERTGLAIVRDSIPSDLRLSDLSRREDYKGEKVSSQCWISLPKADQSLTAPLNNLDRT